MTTLRLRFKLNPDRPGVALGKLSKQTESIEMFLRSLAADLGLSDAPNLWLAKEFKNGSCISTAEMQAVVDASLLAEFNAGVEALIGFDGDKHVAPAFVSAATIGRFAAIRQGLDIGEPIGLSTFDIKTGRPKRWRLVDRLHFEKVAASIDSEVLYVGAVMGTTYDWIKGAKEPYLTIRELNSAELVKCVYSDEDYAKVASLFADKAAFVIIGGTVVYDRITGKTEVTRATTFDLAPEFADEEFERFFGCAPNLTGSLGTDDFVKGGRNDE